jgi:hypothetical protein
VMQGERMGRGEHGGAGGGWVLQVAVAQGRQARQRTGTLLFMQSGRAA